MLQAICFSAGAGGRGGGLRGSSPSRAVVVEHGTADEGCVRERGEGEACIQAQGKGMLLARCLQLSLTRGLGGYVCLARAQAFRGWGPFCIHLYALQAEPDLQLH